MSTSCVWNALSPEECKNHVTVIFLAVTAVQSKGGLYDFRYSFVYIVPIVNTALILKDLL